MGNSALAAGEFKATCLALMDEVAATGREVVITKRGKPVAKLVPVTPTTQRPPIRGLLKHVIRITGDLQKPIIGYEYDMAKKWDRIEAQADERIRSRVKKLAARVATKKTERVSA